MRPTLRLVIGGICALSVLIVAVVTLSITYSVSLATVRTVGKKHAVALASTARVQAESYFAVPAEALNSINSLFSLDGWYALSDDPRNPSLDIHDKFLHMSYALHRNSNYTYTAVGVIFDDGSGCNSYQRPLFNRTVLHWESRSAWQYPARNMTGKRRGLDIDTGLEVTQSEMDAFYRPWVVNVDVRFGAYQVGKNFIGDGSGFWFPMQLFIRTGLTTPEFVLPAAKPLYNATRHFLGFAILAQPVTSLNDFLRSVKGTPNTQAFAVDGNGLLVASTHPDPFFTTRVIADASAPVPRGCASSADTDFGFDPALYLGCRTSAASFSYAPLRAAAAVDSGAFLKTTSSDVRIVDTDNGQYYVASTSIRNRFRFFGINIVTLVPESDVLGDIVAGRNLAIGVTVAIFVFASLLSTGVVYALLQPLSDVSRRMRDTAKLRDADNVENYSRLAEVQDLQRAYTNMNTAIRSFTRYVPRDVVKDLMSTGQLCSIQMTPQVCTMLFVDIAGFTTICERVPPDTLSTLVSNYFDRASRIVMNNDGLIDKFIGDCIMAVWGAPFAVANQEVKATLAGLLLHRETMVAPLAPQWDDAGELLRIRVGISTGEVLAGNMGSADRMNYTVIGDPVNLAARLESMNKQFDTRVMVSEMTAERMDGVFVLRFLMPIAVVGKEKPVKVYEVMGLLREFDPTQVARLQDADRQIGLEENGTSDHGSSDAASVSEAPQRHRTARARPSKAATVVALREAAMRTASEAPLTCTVEELQFSAMHTAAVETYMRGDFADAIGQLDRAEKNSPTVFEDSACRVAACPRRSLDLVRSLCELYLQQGRPDDFDGVFRALEK